MTTTSFGSSSSSSTGSVNLAATLATRSLTSSSSSDPLAALTHPESDPSTADLLALLSQYADRIAALEQRAAPGTLHPANLIGRSAEGGTYDPEKYRHLGKPVGGTFIAVALVFLMLGEWSGFAASVPEASDTAAELKLTRRLFGLTRRDASVL